LRMIEEFLQALSRIRALKRGERWGEAGADLDSEFQRLVASGAMAVAQLSETELQARLVQGEPTAVVRTKTRLLISLLNEAGEMASAQGRREESRAYYLRGLHLLLGSLGQDEAFESPEFGPGVEGFAAALADAPLPLQTQALLMRHYEGTGQFAKAEDMLFGMLELEPENLAIVDFGLAFYERLDSKSDASLASGNLPRQELGGGLAELRSRKSGS
jgi:hypothetical protein